jgi:AraC-like DNA-binding protein
MNLLEVRVEAFAICEIARSAALKCDPMDKIVVHFVLEGTGFIQCKQGKFALRPGTVIIVPRHFAKIIAGAGPIESTADASQYCPLENGLIKFKPATGEPDLVIGCALLDVSLDNVMDVFEHLWEPMVEDAVGPEIDPLLFLIKRELLKPDIGSRAIVGALMKQVLIAVFREQLSREAYRSWLWPAMMHPQLAKAAIAIMSRPQDPHTVQSLAVTAGMSRSRFSEVFSKAFGRGPMEFVQVVRLRAARRLIICSSLPVKSVAAAVGYASRSHFSRAYQAYYGEAPSAFRAEAEPIVEIAAETFQEPQEILSHQAAAMSH